LAKQFTVLDLDMEATKYIYIYVHEKKAQKQEVAYVTYKLEVSKKDTVGNLRIEAGWTQNCT